MQSYNFVNDLDGLKALNNSPEVAGRLKGLQCAQHSSGTLARF